MDNERTEKFKSLKAAIHVAMVLVFERERVPKYSPGVHWLAQWPVL